MNWKLIVLIIAIVCMAIFVFQNMTIVQVQFLFWRLEASRVVIYLSLFLIGFGVGWIGNSMRRRR